MNITDSFSFYNITVLKKETLIWRNKREELMLTIAQVTTGCFGWRAMITGTISPHSGLRWEHVFCLECLSKENFTRIYIIQISSILGRGTILHSNFTKN